MQTTTPNEKAMALLTLYLEASFYDCGHFEDVKLEFKRIAEAGSHEAHLIIVSLLTIIGVALAQYCDTEDAIKEELKRIALELAPKPSDP